MFKKERMEKSDRGVWKERKFYVHYVNKIKEPDQRTLRGAKWGRLVNTPAKLLWLKKNKDKVFNYKNSWNNDNI